MTTSAELIKALRLEGPFGNVIALLGFEQGTEIQGQFSKAVDDGKGGEAARVLERMARACEKAGETAACERLLEGRNYVLGRFGKTLASEKQQRVAHVDESTMRGILDGMLPGQKEVKTWDAPTPFLEIKSYLREYIFRRFRQSDADMDFNRFVYPFLVSNDFSRTGTLVMRLFDTPQNIELLATGVSGKGEAQIRFFGEQFKFHAPADTFTASFYVYQFVEDGTNERYIVFSRQELSTQHCRVTGMSAGQPDSLTLGSKGATAAKLKCVFATNIENDVIKLDDVAFTTVRNFPEFTTHEGLAKAFLGEYRHPQQFEVFLLAWLFSGKPSGYPLHIGWISGPGFGKTDAMDALAKHTFGEEIFDGSSSTFKQIVPHYGGKLPDPGFFARCRRIAVVDELLYCIHRSGVKGSSDETQLLTTILEHKDRISGSGNHEPLRIKATAKAAFLANNLESHGNKTMADMSSSLNRAFLSRVLWYWAPQSHFDFVRKNKRKFDSGTREEKMPKYDPRFISMFDYLNDTLLLNDKTSDAIECIFETYKDLVPVECQPIYQARMDHHLGCLIDGVAKYNSIIQKREVLEVRDEDIALAEEIYAMAVLSWSSTGMHDIMKVPVKARKSAITLAQRTCFDYVDKQPSIKEYEVKKAGFSVATVDALVSYELLKVKLDHEGKKTLYPFWYTKGFEGERDASVGSEAQTPSSDPHSRSTTIDVFPPQGLSPQEKRGLVLNVIRDLLRDHESADEELVVTQAQFLDVRAEETRAILAELKKEGDVREVYNGGLRLR